MKKIFISYSHKDESWKERVVSHLNILPDIEPWDDRRIKGGEDWYREIETSLHSSDMAILLVSAHFLNSKFIREEEIPRLLKRRENEGLIVYPIILYDCAWRKIDWLGKLNARPKDGAPLSTGDKPVREAELASIAEEIFDLLNEKETSSKPSGKMGILGTIPRRCFIEIKRTGNSFTGAIHQGDIIHSRPLPDPRLDNNALISVKNKTRKLGRILKSIVKTDPKNSRQFDESFQLGIGQHLHDQLFSEYKQTEPPMDIDLHITTKNDNVLALPWHVLSDKRVFLSSIGWSVSLSCHSGLKSCTLPDSPRLLIAAPQPAGKPETKADAHLEALEDRLSAKSHSFTMGQNLDVARTWEEFLKKIETFAPDAIYFYGRCMGPATRTMLCFASGKKRKSRDISGKKFTAAIKKMAKKPKLVYLNCLHNAVGLINFGTALGKYVPAVITSRHLYTPEAAREQGVTLLLDILTEGAPPHRAATALYGKLDESLDISTAQARWMTPAVFRRYDEWIAKTPKPLARRIHDPHWHLKIDRVGQFSVVNTQTMQMLREGTPRCLSFVWYGTKGQGVKRFHHRLNLELRDYAINFNTSLFEIRPEWPRELDRPEIAFRDCLTEAFQVRTLEDIPLAIRKMNWGITGVQTLVYVRHAPVFSSRLINPKSLRLYLKWWDETVIPLLGRNHFVLLSASFIVKNPPKFRNVLLKKEKLEDMDLKHIVFRLLDEMERLARRDLLDFFKTHNIHLPIENRDRIIAGILEKTGGHYEKTVEQLQRLVEQSWDLGEEEQQDEDVEPDDYDY